MPTLHALPWLSLCSTMLLACSDDKTGGSSSTDPAARLRAAVVLGSCVPDDGIQRMLYGLTYTPEDPRFGDRAAQVACLTKATDGCAAVARCTNVTVSQDEACQEGCNGQVLTLCDDASKFQVECPSDMRCDATIGDCVSKTAASCDPETDQASRCDGARIVYCAEGVEMPSEDCGANGLTCAVIDGDAQCVGSGAACNHNVRDTCKDAGTLVSCEGGKLHETACGSFGTGFACFTLDADPDYAYCGRASACDPTDDGANHCEGTSIVACDAGAWTPVDCTSLGFSGCVGEDDDTRCTPSPLMH